MAGVGEAQEHRNEVVLVGRLAVAATSRTLPSGDELLQFRVVVTRPVVPPRHSGARAPTVDTLDCVARRGDVRRTVAAWSPGDVVQLEGSLRRRFWRSAGGPASRSEVEITRARRLRRHPD